MPPFTRPARPVLLLLLAWVAGTAPAAAARLQVHPDNPRWLSADGGETAIVLTGAHTWSILQDYEDDDPFPAIGYMRDLRDLGHTFTRGWYWEDGYYSPLPYVLDDDLYRLSPPYSQQYLKR